MRVSENFTLSRFVAKFVFAFLFLFFTEAPEKAFKSFLSRERVCVCLRESERERERESNSDWCKSFDLGYKKTMVRKLKNTSNLQAY